MTAVPTVKMKWLRSRPDSADFEAVDDLGPSSGGWSDPKPGSPTEKWLPMVQLYDLRSGIDKTQNVQTEHPEIVARLASLLQKYIADGRSTPGTPEHNDDPIKLLKTTSISKDGAAKPTPHKP